MLVEGVKKDKFGVTLVNFSYAVLTGAELLDDPFVLASQVDKVFYSHDPKLEGVGVDADEVVDGTLVIESKEEVDEDEDKEKFEFAPVETEEIRSWVMSDIGKKWKTWKYELKKRQFDSSLTVDEIVAAQTDTRVEKKDFKNLVTHWFCEDAQ
ncbi:transposase, Ptta/En/Spm, partial [Tanacetum coccineum]